MRFEQFTVPVPGRKSGPADGGGGGSSLLGVGGAELVLGGVTDQPGSDQPADGEAVSGWQAGVFSRADSCCGSRGTASAGKS